MDFFSNLAPFQDLSGSVNSALQSSGMDSTLSSIGNSAQQVSDIMGKVPQIGSSGGWNTSANFGNVQKLGALVAAAVAALVA